jgi:hypothetical protein
VERHIGSLQGIAQQAFQLIVTLLQSKDLALLLFQAFFQPVSFRPHPVELALEFSPIRKQVQQTLLSDFFLTSNNGLRSNTFHFRRQYGFQSRSWLSV